MIKVTTKIDDKLFIKAKLIFVECLSNEPIIIFYNKETGKLFTGIGLYSNNFNGKYLALKPVLISDTEEIHIGDRYLMFFDNKWEIMYPCADKEEAIRCNNHNSIKHNCRKILALPEQFSNDSLHEIVIGKINNKDNVYLECENICIQTALPCGMPCNGNCDMIALKAIKTNIDNKVNILPLKSIDSWDEVKEYLYNGDSEDDKNIDWIISMLEEKFNVPTLKEKS